MKKIILLLILVSFSQINADDHSDALNAVKRKDYPTALNLFKKSCNSGNPGSCEQLANHYAMGTFGKTDWQTALPLYIKACEGNLYGSCNNAGMIYKNELGGVKRDINKALPLFEKACNATHSIIDCMNLAKMLADYSRTPADLKKSFEIRKNLCDEIKSKDDKTVVCNDLGTMYANGSGTEKDYIKAYDLFIKTCKLQNSMSCYNAGYMHIDGLGVEKSQKMAKKYFKKSCKYGNKEACKLI